MVSWSPNRWIKRFWAHWVYFGICTFANVDRLHKNILLSKTAIETADCHYRIGTSL